MQKRMLFTARWVAVVALSGTGVVRGQAPQPDVAELMSAHSLTCSFSWVTSVEWKGDVPEISSKETRFGFHIDRIDLAKNTARLGGNGGPDNLVAVKADAILSFFEQNFSGSVDVTTVYAWKDKPGRFKSVHSRHASINGPFPMQYYGYCQPSQ
jgi:hypothetical protein